MVKRLLRSLFCGVFSLLLVFCLGLPAAQAANNPELLPKEVVPIVDLARALTAIQETKLGNVLADIEAQTGWKVRVLTQYDRSPGRAVKDYWQLDDRSLLVVADARGGNLLNFNVGGDFYRIFPRTFWIELQTRFGNQYYVRDHGEDGAILDSLDALVGCLRQGGCSVVPGLPREQWILTLVTSVIGGLVCGFAAYPRKPGQIVAWQWALIFSPLWGMLFIAFGLGPVLSRTSDWIPLTRNIAGFLIAALAAYLSLQFRESTPSET